MRFKNLRNLRYLVSLIGLILLIFIGLPDSIIYSKSGIEHWLPFILIIIGVPFLLYKSLQDLIINKDLIKTISLGSILVIGPSFGLWKEYLSTKDLDKNGELKKGIVVQKWYVRKQHSSEGEWLYKAEFRIMNNIFYTYSNVDENNSMKVGDTVLIKYSSQNPENNIIMGNQTPASTGQ